MESVNIAALIRVFKLGTQELTDPNPKMQPIEVLKYYSNLYPELTNSGVSGPRFENDQAVYEFKISIGTKG